MNIGKLAQLTNCEVVTIRYYEKEGLLASPPRAENNYRLYSPKHVERLKFIRHCRSLDMPISDIKKLLHLKDSPNEGCQEVNDLVDAHIDRIESRIEELAQLKKHILHIRNRCQGGRKISTCQILEELTVG